MSLEELQAKYVELFGKLPPNKKNDSEWLLNKINNPEEPKEEKVIEWKAVWPQDQINLLQEELIPLQAKYRNLMNESLKQPHLKEAMIVLEKEIQAIISKQRYLWTLIS